MDLSKIPQDGKTEKNVENVEYLLAFLDETGGRKAEPAFDAGRPLVRAQSSLASLKGGTEYGRMPVRVARRMAQDILTAWQVKY